MIHVYDIGNTHFERNGDAILQPTAGTMKQVAGGGYDLSMTHPLDPEGKWKHLVAGAILKIPVPKETIENAFTGYAADLYVTTAEAEMREGPTEPQTISYNTWSISANYAVGAKVTWNNRNWRCTYFDETSAWANISPDRCGWWTQIPRSTPGAAVVATLPAGTTLYFVEDVDANWYRMSTEQDVVGYIRKNVVQFDKHLTPSETQPRVITTQLFRITDAAVDTKSSTATVTAQHVSYDLNGVLVQHVKCSQAAPAMAISRITGAFMIPYRGTISTNLKATGNGKYTEEIKGKNGVYCLMDPDKGIVSRFDAALKRDNWDWFILKRKTTNRGYSIRYRKNMKGVTRSDKSDGLITRVVPVAKDAGGGDLYLPEKWVDSSRISNYPVIKMEMLTVKGQVGKDKGLGDDSTWTEADLLAEMRTKAGERFTVDHADEIVTEITVDFEQLGDTAEYAWLKGQETILLYDTVSVEHEGIGLNEQLTVTELEWDFIREKVTAVKLANVTDKGGKNVTGYNVQSKSIGSEKLADEVTEAIVSQVNGMIPEYSDPDAKRDARNVVDNLTSTSASDVLSANQGRVLKGITDGLVTRVGNLETTVGDHETRIGALETAVPLKIGGNSPNGGQQIGYLRYYETHYTIEGTTYTISHLVVEDRNGNYIGEFTS